MSLHTLKQYKNNCSFKHCILWFVTSVRKHLALHSCVIVQFCFEAVHSIFVRRKKFGCFPGTFFHRVRAVDFFFLIVVCQQLLSSRGQNILKIQKKSYLNVLSQNCLKQQLSCDSIVAKKAFFFSCLCTYICEKSVTPSPCFVRKTATKFGCSWIHKSWACRLFRPTYGVVKEIVHQISFV